MKRLHNRALSLKQMMMSGVLALAVLLAGIFALPTLAPSADNVVGTNVGLSGDDNGKNNFPIGFTFKYWGIDYTTFGVSINGWVSLKNTASGAYGNPDFPMSDSVLDGLIAPFFDDIRTDVEGQPEGIIFYLTIGQEPNRILVIQWNDMYFYGSNLPMGTFEVLLYESTNEIKFQYRYRYG